MTSPDEGFSATRTLGPLDRAISNLRTDFETAIKAGVEIPSVSMDPTCHLDVLRCAQWAADLCRSVGATSSIVETGGNPVVHGHLAHRGATRSVAVYNHLDVQPAGEPEWRTDPFKLVVDGDKFIGRGSTDDKGPAIAALFGAKLAHQAGIPLDIHFFWELEEEIGSPNFPVFLESAPRVDSVVVSDTVWISRRRPATPLGLRGMQVVRLLLETGEYDAHSGLAGGAARNPVAELCDLVAAMVDGMTGDVKIPRFYEEVRLLSPEDLQGFVDSGFDAHEFQRVHGFNSLRFRETQELMRRIWALPTLEVHGIAGGYQGTGVKSIIPPRAEAKISMRLVPDMTPAKALERLSIFVRTHNPDVVIIPGASLAPYLAPAEGPHIAALRRAVFKGFGAQPALVREGGSIGAVVQMQHHLGCPIVFLGLSLPEHGYHAPNEYFDWEMAAGGMRAFHAYFEEVAAI